MKAPARSVATLVCLLAALPVGARPESQPISGLVDDLQRIQVRVAQGDKAAYAEQLSQLKTIGAAIAAAKPEAWKDGRQAEALAIYILSGGALADVAPLLKDDVVAESARPLVLGAAAYVTNHAAEALGLIGPLDPAELAPRLAGQIAFARSVLETKRDPKAAVAFLDWARLVAPGTLVEEAALRREIPLLVETRDAPRATTLIRQYATRFPASPYAADFFRELAGEIAQIGLGDGTAPYQLLAKACAARPPDDRRAFLLTLAKAATVGGRFDAASAAASEVLRDVRPGSPEEARAHLYLAASRIASADYDTALGDLQRVPASQLDPSDAALLASVQRVATQMRAPPGARAIEAQGEAPPDAAAEGSTIRLAEEALKRTSNLGPEGGP